MKGKTITLFETTIRQDENGRYSLNDLHKAAMAKGYATKSQRPGAFLQSDSVKAFVEAIDTDATIIASVKKVKGGKNQGTYATELVALRYAGWISAKVEVEVYKTFQKVLHNDEGLTHQLIEGQQDLEAQKRLAARAQSKVVRQTFTDGLKQHGVAGIGYAMCTNAIYEELFGTDAKGLRELKKLPQKANVREAMDRREIVASMFAEEMALLRIERDKAKGNSECADQSRKAGRHTKQAIDSE